MTDEIVRTDGTATPLTQVAAAPSDDGNAKTIEQMNERLPGIIQFLVEFLEGFSGDNPSEETAADESQDVASAANHEMSVDIEQFIEEEYTMLAPQEMRYEAFPSDEEMEAIAEELSEIETASGSNVVLSDAPEIDFGDAPTLDSFQAPGDVSSPSAFFNNLAGAGSAGIGLGGQSGIGLTAGSVSDFKAQASQGTGDSNQPLTPALAAAKASAAQQGGTEFVSGTDGTDDSFTVTTPVSDTPSGPVQIGKTIDKTVTVEGGGLDLEIDDVEQIEVNTGSGNDSVEIGDLTETDANSVTINTGDGDDVVFVSDQQTVGVDLNINGGEGNDTLGGSNGNDNILGEVGDDTFFGGSGGDTLDGGVGNDTIFGNGGEHLAGAHDWEVTNDMPVFSEFQPFNTATGVSADDANYTFDSDATVTARLVSVGTANTNSIGYYKIGATGEISDVTFLFQANGGSTDQPGDVIDIDISGGETLGLFIFAGGVNGFDTDAGQFEIRDISGDPATTASTSTRLFFTTDTGDTALSGSLYHTTNPTMNAGGKDAAFVGFNDANAGLRIGFDDDVPFIVDDKDFNDVVIELFERAFDPNESDDDVLLGGAGNDSLFGEGGNDILNGGEDDDVLFGGSGNDILIGGAGSDKLYGNEGDDVFQFSSLSEIPSGGRDVIMDFETQGDKIFLDGILTGSVLDNLISGDLVISTVPGTDGRTLELGFGDKTIEVNLVDDGVFTLDHITTSAPAV